MTRLLTALSLFGVVAAAHAAPAHDVFDRVHDHFADHDGVRIHWVELGRPLPPVQAPTLLMHGLADVFLLPVTIEGTWQWVADTLTSVTVPGVGHFIQQDAADTVTTTLQRWLDGLPLRR